MDPYGLKVNKSFALFASAFLCSSQIETHHPKASPRMGQCHHTIPSATPGLARRTTTTAHNHHWLTSYLL